MENECKTLYCSCCLSGRQRGLCPDEGEGDAAGGGDTAGEDDAACESNTACGSLRCLTIRCISVCDNTTGATSKAIV